MELLAEAEWVAGSGFVAALRHQMKIAALTAIGRYRALAPDTLRFRGAFASHEEALKNVRPGKLRGYDNDDVTEVSKELMQQVPLWDYPILYWLKRLSAEPIHVVDAGGHIGVKYRAFEPYLDLARIEWTVYDLPALVRAGRKQARPTDRTLSFVERLEDAAPADVLLASGLMPYLDRPLPELVRRLRRLPRHILLNKVVTRDGPTVVTLENFRVAEVPYHVRDEREVPQALDGLGYDIVDRWTIDSQTHRIETHPELGPAFYRGYAARRRRDD
ncbi:MAG: methyltransferase, TIGR04325 family [Enhydrobacter sp.]|nr:MAG: methyltransferase, TIGR04325 family [Enhydrobacter sp.]